MFGVLGLFWTINQLYGEVLTQKILSQIPENRKGMILSAIIVLGFCYFSFLLGKDWHSFQKPLTKLKAFFNKKIREGEKLYKSKLPDVARAVTPNAVPDYGTIEPFRFRYEKWRKQIGDVIHIAAGDITLDNLPSFQDVQVSQPKIVGGQYRIFLKQDIEHLHKIQQAIKSEWLNERFIPENIEEYELD